MNALQSYTKDLNLINKFSWSWNTSMVALYMDTWKENQTDKWQKLKQNTCGSKLSLVFIIFIKEMSLTETLS